MGFNVDVRTIENYLRDVVKGHSQPRAAEFLLVALGRPLAKHLSAQPTPENLRRLKDVPPNAPGWLRQSFHSGNPVYEFQPNALMQDQIRHIGDWIVAGLVSDAPWTQDCDEHGRPYKLLKIGSLEQATSQADKAMLRSNAPLANLADTDGGHTEVEMTFPDGAIIVRLLSPEALDDESRRMGHCIGHGSYDKALSPGVKAFFSVRTPFGKSCATLEVDLTTERGTLLQCKGKQNKPPLPKYMPYIQGFLKERQHTLKVAPRLTGLIEKDGVYYDIRRLPDAFHHSGNLDLSFSDIDTLPPGLIVDGDLDLGFSNIRELPDGLTVNGSLQLGDTKLSRLPDTLKVGSCLRISDTNIAELPKGLHVPFILCADRTPLTKLPEDLRVDGGLTVRGTAIHNVPDGVRDVLVSNLQTYQHLLAELEKHNRVGILHELPSLLDRPEAL